MAGISERFGRPLRLGIVGGGPDSWIGKMHRSAAELDGTWRAVAGVFSSDSARSRAAGAAMGFDGGRSYGDLGEMLERERLRADPIDAVAIMTPNDTHYAVAARRSTRDSTWSATSRSRTISRKPAISSRARDGSNACSPSRMRTRLIR